MRLAAILLVVLVLLIPAASATATRGTAIGAANFYTSGHLIVGWDDFVTGAAYDVDDSDDGAYLIVKLCSHPDTSYIPAACVREDLYPLLS